MKVHPTVQKKLQRLPHVFAKFFQLPFSSDTEISVQETSEFFLFTAIADDMTENVRVQAIKIYSRVTKMIVIRGLDDDDFLSDEVGNDLWRFRLPASTRPEIATARFCDGELVVTVPKCFLLEDNEEEGGGNCINNGENGKLLLK